LFAWRSTMLLTQHTRLLAAPAIVYLDWIAAE